MFRKIEEFGYDIVNELHAHLDQFHAGLDDLEQRMLHRQANVKGRLAELEDENAEIAAGLDKVQSLRK